MRLPRRVVASAVTSTLLLAGLAGCTSDGDKSGGTGGDKSGGTGDIVIGADVDNSSAVDAAYVRALRLRVEQVNASGQLGKQQLRLAISDNRSDPTDSLRNISSFADNPGVAAIVAGSCDECVVGAAKTINDRKVPTIALAASDEVAAPVADRRYLFKLGPNSADSAATMVAELQRVKVPDVAILYTDNLYGLGSDKAVEAQLKKAGIKVAAFRTVKPTATDISQAVGELVGAKPAALLVLTEPDQATLAATSAKAAGYQGRVFFDAAAASDQFIPPGAAAAVDNTTLVFTQILAIDDVIATTPAKAARQQWFRDYVSRYGSYSGWPRSRPTQST